MAYPSTVDAGLQGMAATIFVAASNASAKSQARADFVCSGSGDQATVALAVAALPSVGGRIVFSEGDFYTSSPYLIVSSAINFSGMGSSTKFHSTTVNACFASSSTAFSDVSFELITFIGPVSNTVSVPTRARTTSGNGIDSAIKIDGSLDTVNGSFPLITNITVKNCNFRNTTWSPIRIFGITGKTIVTDNEFYNCEDPGFVLNQEVTFNDNYVLMSADNGVSFSRLSNKIVCVGNTFENICQNAIWVAGFTGTEGPNTFTIVGNTIKICGNDGIHAVDAPKFGVIADNSITQGYNRGAVDQPTDGSCSGISIVGYPSASAPSFTDSATNISVTGNQIYQCPKAGIYYDGVAGLDIKNNLICDTGTQFFSDGSTAITASYISQNVGIMAGHLTTNSNVVIQHNTIVDQRGTPYCNWAMYPYTNFTGTGVSQSGNVMAGCRNANNMAPLSQNAVFGQGSDGVATLDGTVTVAWASKSGSTYTLTRDVYCSDLTINSGVAIATTGYTITCSGTLTNNGTISASGGNGVGATAGSGATGSMLRGGGAGTTATTGAGTAGNTLSGALGGAGGAGGTSGANTGGAGGTLNNPAANVGSTVSPQKLPWSTMGLFISGAGTIQGWAGGSAGGSGGGDGTNTGGGPGGGGGVIIITARFVVLGSGAIFKSLGGAGGNAAGGNAAGGGGGGGGLIIINTTSFTGTTPTAANSCTGGTAGTSSGSGTAAAAGANGAVFLNIFS